MILKGTAHRFGDDISTDAIMPSKYLTSYLPSDQLATHALEGADPAFAERVREGDLVVGGRNFGCGSSREEAVIGLQATGIAAVVAESFGRIFYRNAINRGLLVMECPGLQGRVAQGDEVELRPEEGLLRDANEGIDMPVHPLSPTAAAILKAGGLLPYVKARIDAEDR